MPTPAATLAASTRLEIVQRAAVRQLVLMLNDELANQEQAWAQIDQADARVADVVYRPVELERMRPKSFHTGARPSLLRMPVDHFPALTVMADMVRPDQDSILHDSRNVLRDALWVEMVVRSEPHDPEDVDDTMVAEDVVGKRAKRSGEAVIQAILREPTLGAAVEPIETAPALTVSEPFLSDSSEPSRGGKRTIFANARIDFTLKVWSLLPETVEPVPDPLLAGVGA